jgi:tRNA 2-thiouridine synthesizing protein E
MATMTIAGKEVQVNEEGFLTNPDEWTEDIAKELAKNLEIDLTDEHWKMIKFMREDFKAKKESPTSRRMQAVGGFAVKDQFALFPKKPAKKLAYISGVPKPKGCV